MKTKPLDCVKMMHRGAKRIHEATRGMSRQDEVEHWKARAKELLPTAQPAVHRVGVVREARTTYRVAR